MAKVARKPRELSTQEARGLTLNVEKACIKKTDCTLYSQCLDQAVSGKWAGFSCVGCNAYAEPDAFQKMCDHVRLRALDEASRIMEEYGGPCRVRGVKPGADAKRTIAPPVETVPLVLALDVD